MEVLNSDYLSESPGELLERHVLAFLRWGLDRSPGDWWADKVEDTDQPELQQGQFAPPWKSRSPGPEVTSGQFNR